MKSRQTTSNYCLLNQEQENFTHKEEPKPTLIKPSFYIPGEINNNEFSSNSSKKKNNIEVRIDNNFPFQNAPEYDQPSHDCSSSTIL